MNQTITDPVFGNTAVVEAYVANFTLPQSVVAKYAALDGGQVVLVKAKVTAGTKYYGTFGSDDFWITGTANGIDVPATDDLDALNAAVTAAGYSPILDNADTGKTAEGWMIFTLQHPQAHLNLTVRRLAYGTNTGATIAAKDFTIKLR